MAVTAESPEVTRLRVATESSPPSSAESNFRELDDAFLQTQTRIWLGEVLQIRFDEEMNVCDLLADGELLFEVSEVISRMLPTPVLDATHLKGNEWKSLASSKSTRRYMPYYNVDSFLRVCKKLGLDGIDLFTPSDVVEKRETRKVCMCIRSLSKKARSRDLNVPDFDSVTCTLSMPTDMVECIRKSLELSQCSSSLSVGHDSEKVLRVRCWRRRSTSASAVSNGYASDPCDDAETESGFMVADSYGSTDYAFDTSSPNIPKELTDHSSDPKLHLNMEDLENVEGLQCEYMTPTRAESVGSPCSQYYSDEELSSMPSSTCLGSCISGKVLEVNGEVGNGYQNGDVTHIPINWGDSSLDIRSYRYDNANNDGTDNLSREEKDRDSTYCNSSSLIRENNNMRNEKSSGSCDKIELVTCTNSVAARGSDLDVPCECAVDYLRTDEDYTSKFKSLVDEQVNNNALEHEIIIYRSNGDIVKSYSDGKFKDNDLSIELQIERRYRISNPMEHLDCSSYNDENHASQIYNEVIGAGGNSTLDHIESRADSDLIAGDMSDGNDILVAKEIMKFSEHDSQDTQKGSEDPNILAVDNKPIGILEDAICINGVALNPSDPWPGALSPESVENTGSQDQQCAEDVEKVKTKGESELKKDDDTDKEMKPSKPQRTLLRSVVKGTALVGIAFFLLHLRKNSRENPPKVENQPGGVHGSTPKRSSQKGQKDGNKSSVYPAEKLNLGL